MTAASAAAPAALAEAARLFGVTPEPAPLAGDVGNRLYVRAGTRAGAACLLVLYPEPRSAPQAAWAEIGAALAAAGVRVPALLDEAPDLGAALEEDLGDRDLAAELAAAPREDALRLLDEAEELLYGVRAVARSAAAVNPPFSAEFFARELAHTRTWALEAGGDRPLDAERRARWDERAGALAAAAADPERTGDFVATHRDFHANNLLRAPDGTLAVIDFQDLRMGPPDYDPVSLRCERAGGAVDGDPPGVSEAVLLQRAWKVLGTFEKMLRLGRTVYAPHRDRAVAAIRARTRPAGPWAPLLEFLPS